MNRRTFIKTSALAGVAMGWPRRMSWAAETADVDRLRFVYFTDIHARTEWNTPEALAKAADLINAQNVDLAICGGDQITEGYDSSVAFTVPRWDAYYENLHRRIAAPVHTAIGNHDIIGVEPRDGSPPEADPKSTFRARLNLDRTYYSFDALGAHFIVLDAIEITKDERKYRGFVDAAQMDWLRADAQALAPQTPIVLVSHMPLMTGFFELTEGATAPAPENRVVVNALEVLKVFEHRNLLLVLQGHLHVNEFYRWRGITFVTGGAVCGKWWRGSWHGTPAGLGLVTVRGGRVDWEYLDLGWQARRPPNL